VIALWAPNFTNKVCAYEGTLLTDPCINCQTRLKSDFKVNLDSSNISQCALVQGVCNHTFHKHCIEAAEKKKTTPIF
jgi:hypothetical protein